MDKITQLFLEFGVIAFLFWGAAMYLAKDFELQDLEYMEGDIVETRLPESNVGILVRIETTDLHVKEFSFTNVPVGTNEKFRGIKSGDIVGVWYDEIRGHTINGPEPWQLMLNGKILLPYEHAKNSNRYLEKLVGMHLVHYLFFCLVVSMWCVQVIRARRYD